jgi:hypothetical protein
MRRVTVTVITRPGGRVCVCVCLCVVLCKATRREQPTTTPVQTKHTVEVAAAGGKKETRRVACGHKRLMCNCASI